MIEVRITVTTASTAGAVAIIQLLGPGAADLLRQVTNHDTWPTGRLRLSALSDLDEGLAVLLTDQVAQLMPHGGPRVVQKLVDRLIELGARYDADPPPRELYPEAESDLEADLLAALAKAASPAAIDLLLAQPALWAAWADGSGDSPEEILRRSDALDRLITPPTVVVVGRPNVGKSTLTNRMLGRTASLVADLPGTTRDWVAGLADLNGVVVRWLDTPGIRASDDPIEQRAIELARGVIASADVLIAMRDPPIDWPDQSSLPRRPDLWLMNKCDASPSPNEPKASARERVAESSRPGEGTSKRAECPLPEALSHPRHPHPPRRLGTLSRALEDSLGEGLPISAVTGQGLDELKRRVLEKLGLDDIATPRLWAFTSALRQRLIG